MTAPTAEAKNLIDLAERMGIPTDAAFRQVEQLEQSLNRQRDARVPEAERRDAQT
jgi:hypothetical protein